MGIVSNDNFDLFFKFQYRPYFRWLPSIGNFRGRYLFGNKVGGRFWKGFSFEPFANSTFRAAYIALETCVVQTKEERPNSE